MTVSEPDEAASLAFDTMDALLQARSRLNGAGIPTRILNKQQALQTIYPRQQADAQQLLANPNHTVVETLSDEELRAARLTVAKEQQGNILRLAWQLGQVVSVGLVLALLISWLMGQWR